MLLRFCVRLPLKLPLQLLEVRFRLWYSRYDGFLIQNSAEFTVEMNAKSRNRVCNLGNLANAFEMAASETTSAFSPCWSGTEIRHRICGKVCGKVSVTLRRYLLERYRNSKEEQNDGNYNCKNDYGQAKWKSAFHIQQEVPMAFNLR